MEDLSSMKGELNNNEETNKSEIAEFFKDRSIFLTGATGFIGKVLIEKLLRCCPQIKCIYMLIRPKRGQSTDERRDHLLSNKIYKLVRERHPDICRKVIAMQGDVAEEELGLSQEDRDTLCQEVSVVIHGAATIRFDEPIKQCLELNVKGTLRLIALSRKMTNLKALIHVSTGYAHCDRNYIGEQIYPPPMEPHKLMKCLELMDDHTADIITPVIIGAKRNTYIFAKSLAEYLVNEEAKTLPIVIVRPTIVLGAWKEPLPGWMDNANGPIALSIAVAKGMVRTLRADVSKVCDINPVNFVSNILLVAATHIAKASRNSDGALVLNCSSGTLNPCTWGDYNYWCTTANFRNPITNPYWFPSCSVESSRTAYVIKDFFFHLIPAYLLDVIYKFTAKKPRMMKIYTKLSKANDAVEHFRVYEWKFGSENMLQLWDNLNPYDKKMFNFDFSSIHWPTFFNHQVLGITKYLLKENVKEVPRIRKRIRIYYVLDLLLQFIFYYLLVTLLWKSTFEEYLEDSTLSFPSTNITLRNIPPPITI